MLKNHNVQEKIKSLTSEGVRIAKMERDKIFLEVTRIALFDPIELYNYDGSLRLYHEIPEELRVAVLPNDKESIRILPNGGREIKRTRSFKFQDKSKNLETACRILARAGDGARRIG